MEILIEEFKDAAFLYEGKKYVVSGINIVSGNVVVKTVRRTFVFTPTEFKAFYNAVKFVSVVAVQKESKLVPYKEITSKSTSLNAEIIQANSISARLTDSLEEIFRELAYGDPTDKTYRKAEAMVKATNAIVNVQLANYKYLSLNK